MKKKTLFILPLAILLLIGCNNKPGSEEKSSDTSSTPSSSYDNGLGDAPTYDEPSISIHYHREDGKYTNTWALWLWEIDGDGAEYTFNGIDSFGAVAAYPLSNWANALTRGMGMIIKTAGSWSKQTPDIKVDFANYHSDDRSIYHFYFEQGEEAIYDGNIYESSNTEGVSVAEFTSATNVRVVGSKEMSKVTLKENGQEIASVTLDTPNKKANLDLPSGKKASFDNSYSVDVLFASGNTKSKGVSVNTLYDTEEFVNNYTYDGELGAIYTKESTTFKVWSPVSSAITLKLYDNGTPVSVDARKGNDTPISTHPMTRGEKGVYSVTVSGDLQGKYYTYEVTNSSYEKEEVVDPYAKSSGINGLRGMIVDFSKTNPEGFEEISPLQYDRKELTVWETHVADVTSHKTWTGSEINRRKYAGLVEEGTTYTKNNVTVKTGFDHIKELGVNAVQLLPIFDQANDETTYTFNWGYNPLNYNVVEGMYSKDPYDGYSKIRELKEVVLGFNKAGISTIMDVVYNHVNGASRSNFDVLMPGYYFRYNSDGSYANGSGCGNETASEKPMMRKFMIDSTAFWAKEYKLGGFRFDLMGLHDLETMNSLVANLKTVNPYIVVYGEPWAGGTSAMADYNNKSCKQSNGSKYVGYGQFNDQMRDALIKGGLNGASSLGWITNKENINNGDVTTIQKGIGGCTYNSGYQIDDPNKTVNYVTCHDNYTLYDRIVAASAADTEKEIAQMSLLAESVVFTSSGTTFMLAGDEMQRTKKGNNNSYNAGDNVNALDYGRKVKTPDGVEIYNSFFSVMKDLINFKQTCKGLQLDKPGITVSSIAGGSTFKYTLKSGNDTFIVIHSNGVSNKNAVSLEGNYEVKVDTLSELVGQSFSSVTPKAYQTLILQKI